PVLDDGWLFFTGERHLEQCVMAGGRAQNLPNLLCADGKRYRIALRAVEHGGNLFRSPQSPHFIFASRISRCRFAYNFLCHCLLPSVNSNSTSSELQINNSLIELSS